MNDPPDAAASGNEPIRELFGFDLDEARWLERIRESQSEVPADQGRIGDYEILGIVGRGGQGIVYRARQPHTGREIVLKRTSAGVFATEDMRARLAREVEAASALDHPNIVTVYGSEVIDGQLVLAMQWIDGVPFDEWASGRGGHASGNPREIEGQTARESRRSVREVLQVFTRVCDAVQHAHQRGVIHRDLKPSNILVDAADQPHVLDFGLAKLSADWVVERALTHTGVFVGTPAYAAPELAGGRHASVDVRADVYSLGAMLYQALTGFLVFESSSDLPELLQEIQFRDPRPPSSMDARLGREIDAILLKALSKDKERRYGSVESLGADVQRFLDGQAVLAHPPSTVYRVRKFVRQHVASVTIGTVLLLTVVTAATISTLLYQSAERERRQTAEALKEKSGSLARAEWALNSWEHERRKARGTEIFQDQLLARAHRGAREGVPVITVREVLDQITADMAQRAPTDKVEIEAWIRMAIGNAYAELGLSGSARPQFERALAIRRLLPSDGEEEKEVELDVAESMDKLGRTCRALGDLEQAERMLEGALDLRRKWLKGNDGYFATNTNSLGILKRHRGKFLEAESLFLESLEYYRKGQGPNDESVPVVLKNLGLVYLDTNRLDEAVSVLRDAHDMALELHGARHTDVASCQINLAAALTRLGQLEEAETLCRTAIDTLVELHGDRFGMLAIAQERLAEVSRRTGRLGEAESLLLEALASHHLADNPTDLVRCLRARAEVLREMGRLEEAEARLREGLSLARASFDPAEEIVALQKAALGSLLVEQGCCSEAASLLLEAQPILAFQSTAATDVGAREGEDLNRLLERCRSVEADGTRGAR